jgi:hypothetical protein
MNRREDFREVMPKYQRETEGAVARHSQKDQRRIG